MVAAFMQFLLCLLLLLEKWSCWKMHLAFLTALEKVFVGGVWFFFFNKQLKIACPLKRCLFKALE